MLTWLVNAGGATLIGYSKVIPAIEELRPALVVLAVTMMMKSRKKLLRCGMVVLMAPS